MVMRSGSGPPQTLVALLDLVEITAFALRGRDVRKDPIARKETRRPRSASEEERSPR